MALLRARYLALVAVLAASTLLGPVMASAGTPHEHAVKAAYLYRFSFFVEWPGTAFASDASPLVIGVIGRDPFKAALDRTLKGKTMKGRSVKTRRFADPGMIENCHILYVGDEDGKMVEKVLRRVRGEPTLVVGNGKDFLARGGIIQFVEQSERIRFRIDNAAARRVGLRISSKLLQLAE